MKTALIVAHGQPSDPLPAAAELDRLAARVMAHLPGWQVGAATLAEPGALARAAGGLAPGVVFPMFMAPGWFTRTAIPARLEAAGAEGWRILPPFGTAQAVWRLALQVVRENDPDAVLLAAHGSFKSSEPAGVAHALARFIADEADLPAKAAFIDQEPRLADDGGYGAGTICLPFFAMAGGHVLQDVPAALAQAGFAGRLLPALGTDPRVPALIAGLIAAG